MSQSLKQLCKPRPSIFDKSRRDTVLDLNDLMQKGKVKPEDFFSENYITEGMKALYEGAMRRFEGKSDDGIYRLKQNMGGGKTHNMIALGLLAQFPEYRNKAMGTVYKTSFDKPVKVIAFTGRENPKLGIWGYIAEQLGRKEVFKDYYSPFSAPGQTAWIELLKGDPVLILLDELPPYLEGAKAVQAGTTDLANLTAVALANLFTAIGNNQLKNVCLVISDLTANWTEGMEIIQQVLRNLDSEVGRTAKDLTPVRPNTDEIFIILRKRLFDNEAPENEIKEIAKEYSEALKKAQLTGQTSESPEQFAEAIKASYPFHPGIKDLLSRFKDNPGFQQTRGMIRLMRTFMSRMFDPKNGWADKSFLIHPYDFDLNDPDTITEIRSINRELDSAIAHDIANNSASVAERIDAKSKSTIASETARVILLSSLSTVSSSLRGLSEIDIVRSIVKPGRVPGSIRNEVIIPLTTESWYLHTDREGNILYKDVKNVVAQLNTLAANYNPETVKKDLVEYLNEIFKPKRSDCYQSTFVLTSLDNVQISRDDVSLIIYTPHHAGGLSPELQRFYDDQTYKNRLMFLSGDNKTLNSVNENAAQWKAINQIIAELKAQRVATNSTEFLEADRLKENIQFNLRSALQQTFVKLWYPHSMGLKSDHFSMQFAGNEFNGEEQIINVLKSSLKFTQDVTSDTFRLQCESKLFTQKQLPWNDIKQNAAMNIKWPWHKTDALEQLKQSAIAQGFWRTDGSNWVEKGPFDPPKTEVSVQQLNRDDDTGETTLRITPVHGDTIYFEIGGKATTASSRVTDPRNFTTKELKVSFLCADSAGQHQTGDPFEWKNEITLKYKFFDQGNKKMLELKAAPDAPIRYSTDGSDPLNSGGSYSGPFALPNGVRLVLAAAQKNSVVSNVLKIDVKPDGKQPTPIDPNKPLTWKRAIKTQDSQKTYDFLHKSQRHQAQLFVNSSRIHGKDWWELSTDSKMKVIPSQLETSIESLRQNIAGEGQIWLDVAGMWFPTGQNFLDFLNEWKVELNQDEIEQ